MTNSLLAKKKFRVYGMRETWVLPLVGGMAHCHPKSSSDICDNAIERIKKYVIKISLYRSATQVS